MHNRRIAGALLLGCALPGLVSCADLGLGGLISDVEVVIENLTSFDVQPNIRFDNDSDALAALFPADSLDTGLVAPGEVLEVRFDCDDLGLIFADEPEQVALFADVFGASSSVIRRDDEFDCGDQVVFTFVGNGSDFGVIVSVNGRVVD